MRRIIPRWREDEEKRLYSAAPEIEPNESDGLGDAVGVAVVAIVAAFLIHAGHLIVGAIAAAIAALSLVRLLLRDSPTAQALDQTVGPAVAIGMRVGVAGVFAWFSVLTASRGGLWFAVAAIAGLLAVKEVSFAGMMLWAWVDEGRAETMPKG